jgi:hypothetical protein
MGLEKYCLIMGPCASYKYLASKRLHPPIYGHVFTIFVFVAKYTEVWLPRKILANKILANFSGNYSVIFLSFFTFFSFFLNSFGIFFLTLYLYPNIPKINKKKIKISTCSL